MNNLASEVYNNYHERDLKILRIKNICNKFNLRDEGLQFKFASEDYILINYKIYIIKQEAILIDIYKISIYLLEAIIEEIEKEIESNDYIEEELPF
jgi:hypothetical protein